MAGSGGRFRDGGERLSSFGDDVLVRCPSCGGTAHVIPDPAAPRVARLTCGACGLARTSGGRPEWPRRCARCGKWIPWSRWTEVERGARRIHDHAPCPGCGRVAHAVVTWTVLGAPEDPWFGEPLALQAPCCGEVLWAWNHRHLAVLESLVGAGLRERKHGGSGNGTLLSRLPRWMKAARNREAVLAGIARLRRAAGASS